MVTFARECVTAESSLAESSGESEYHPRAQLRFGRLAERRLLIYQYLPKSSQPTKAFLTTDRHGLTRMKTGFLLSVSIRVHPWLDRIGCGLAALRCIAGCQPASRWKFQRLADWQSAIQQVGNLRYGTTVHGGALAL